MDRFNFFSRNNGGESTTAEPITARQRENRREEYDDESPLSPRVMPDLEAQRGVPVPEMMERPAVPQAGGFLPRFRPAIPSWFSVASSRRQQQQNQVRPPSSHYSGDGLPPDTVVNSGELESPKTPLFRIRPQDLPSTRLHLPNLTRTWTQGSNGPPTRPGTSRAAAPDMAAAEEMAIPTPAVTAAARQVSTEDESDGRTRRHHHRRRGSDGSHRSSRRHHHHRSNNRSPRDEITDSGSRSSRRRRRRDRERDRENGRLDEQEQQSRERHRRHHRRGERAARRPPPPKHFLFCFPWIKSRRMRTQVLRCFVSGILLAMLLTTYLVLSITKNINNSEFTVLLILIILFITIFFCHSLIRICMMVVKGGRNPEDEDSNENSRETTQLPHIYGPGGYAIPREPIRIVMARDEEAAGLESETTKIQPPAYGLWRESVRVDPNRIYWMRNEEATSSTTLGEEEESSSSSSASSSTSSSESSRRRSGQASSAAGSAPRPPSYISDDGVDYVIEAQPRSIAPTSEVPLRSSMHPSELGRAGPPAGW